MVSLYLFHQQLNQYKLGKVPGDGAESERINGEAESGEGMGNNGSGTGAGSGSNADGSLTVRNGDV